MRFKVVISLILLVLSLSYSGYEIYNVKVANSRDVINISSNDIPSTNDWQDTALNYLIRRNELINDVLSGRYDNSKIWAAELKLIECAPLLNGDVLMIDYMSKNPMQFVNKMNNIKVEHSSIRQLTKDEVIMDAKISYTENNARRSYDYEIRFKNIDDVWLLSKFTFAD